MRHAATWRDVIGWLILLIPVAIVIYAGIRLAPVYLNYMKVARVARATLTSEYKTGESDAPTPSATSLEQALRHRERRLSRPSRTSRSPATAQAGWSRPTTTTRRRCSRNISLLVTFDKTVVMRLELMRCGHDASDWPRRAGCASELGYEPRDPALFAPR